MRQPRAPHLLRSVLRPRASASADGIDDEIYVNGVRLVLKPENASHGDPATRQQQERQDTGFQ